MENSGLLKVCNYKFQVVFDEASFQFFENAKHENGVIYSTMNGTPVEFIASDIRELYDFSENALPVDDIIFDQNEVWKVVRVNVMNDELKVSGYKKELRWEFELLSNVIQRCVYEFFGGIDRISVKYGRAMNAIFHGMNVD